MIVLKDFRKILSRVLNFKDLEYRALRKYIKTLEANQYYLLFLCAQASLEFLKSENLFSFTSPINLPLKQFIFNEMMQSHCWDAILHHFPPYLTDSPTP